MTMRKPATRRYFYRVAAMAAAYLVLVFAAGWTFRHTEISGPAAWALAIAPALPIIGVFWAIMRMIAEETDEFMRLLLVRQCLVATGFCLAVMTVWEWLQNYELVAPGNGGFGAAFFWFIGLGVGALYNRVTMGSWGQCW
jgi:hypothetical protein